MILFYLGPDKSAIECFKMFFDFKIIIKQNRRSPIARGPP